MQHAFVLHQRPYGESSQLVELFCAESGRVGALARGARRQKSPWRGLLQPFAPLVVAWRGRGELATLTNVEPAHPAARVAGERIAAGWYVNELVLRVIERGEALPSLFEGYVSVVAALRAAADVEPPLRRFEVLLLGELGYGLRFDVDARSGDAVEAGRFYRLWRDFGPSVSDSSVADAGDDGDGLPLAGETLLALAGQRELTRQRYREAKRATRFLIEPLLGQRRLRTRTLLLEGPR